MASAPLPLPEDEPQDTGEVQLSPIDKLALMARAEGDISGAIDSTKLAQIGSDVIADYERDKRDREDWEKTVEKALAAAAQEAPSTKDFPWPNAANVRYPLLTTASLQFNARAYPAIVKGDEPVLVKVIGNDNGMPQVDPATGQPAVQTDPQTGQQQPVWARPPGAKGKRAQRVATYLNTTIMYRVEDWEADTDALLLQLPIVGCAFRKVCVRDGRVTITLVPAMNLVGPMKARDVASAPRLTEVIEDVYPYQIAERMAAGIYREVELPPDSDDEEAPRVLLEQHRLMDMDGDGVPEPYIITVDKESSEVLRLESNFSMNEAMAPGARVQKLSVYYVKYDFFPHPKGYFYGIGFGHLLDALTDVVNTSINQLLDAGTAQIAGGGFIAGGVRMQGNSSRVRTKPGEYAVVNGVTGSQLRDAIVDRTSPSPSPVAFQLLDMMLGAAKDIASVKDVITGDASNQGQVGTTMALIEQGLQVFTAIYKRVFRSLKAEYQLVFDSLSRWGGDGAASDYANVLDDPMANFKADFDGSDLDIRPVSDPSAVTAMQKMARAQFLSGFIGKGLNDQEIYRRIFEAADVEDMDKLFPDAQTQQQQQQMQQAGMAADIADKQASAAHKGAQAQKAMAQAQKESGLGPTEIADANHKNAQAAHVMSMAQRENVGTHLDIIGQELPGGSSEPAIGVAQLNQQQHMARKAAAEADKAEMEAELLRRQLADGTPPLAADKIGIQL